MKAIAISIQLFVKVKNPIFYVVRSFDKKNYIIIWCLEILRFAKELAQR